MREPSLRTDLIVSRQETSEGIRYVVKDPVARRFFRFRATEYAVARRLDGETSLDAVARAVSAELRIDARPESLRPFVEQLQRLRLLQTDHPLSADPRSLSQRVFGSPLYVRLKAFDPDRLLERLLPGVRFCFTPYFVFAAAALIVWALVTAITNWPEVVHDLGRLWRVESLFLAWVAILTVTAGHEFAHGLTCKRFGGHVHEMGFLLIYFQPAFYCNISDAWLFPEKSRRLWVTFAGAFFEMSVWSLATLVWWITEPDTSVSFLALIVMATSAIKSFFNLNPLIKLDGYYLLSDYLEIPNLRQRSIDYLKTSIKRLCGFGGLVSDVTSRERRIYVTYGLLAAAYSYWLLTVIALRFGGYLVEQYEGPGFVAFSSLMLVAFKNPLGRATTAVRTSFRRAKAGGSTDRPSEGSAEAIRTRRRKIRAALLVLAVAALVLGRLPLNVSGEFTVFPVRNADVRAAVDGIIAEVHVTEGQRVKAGDLLVRLSDRDYRAELEKIDAELAQARATLKMLRFGPRREEISLTRAEFSTARTIHEHAQKRLEEADRIRAMRVSKAEATVKAAEERLRYSRADLARFRELLDRGLVSRRQFDEGQQEVALREKELEAANAELQTISADSLEGIRQEMAVAQQQIQQAGGKLKLLLAGTRPETIEATEADVRRLETARRYIAGQLRRTEVVSPAAGIVTTPKLEERIGEHVKKGDLILEVFEMETVTPELLIAEKEIADVQLGQPVTLKARAYPGLSFAGRVKAIAPAAAVEESGLGRKVFRVSIQMDQPSDHLRPQMTGKAKVYCGRRSIAHLLMRRFARYVRVEFWSWW